MTTDQRPTTNDQRIRACAFVAVVGLLAPAWASAQATAASVDQPTSQPAVTAGLPASVTDAAFGATGWDADDRAVAARFAPVFHQGMVGSRFDFITNFDFDGDWVGDNNWVNSGEARFPQKAYVYYAVSETPTHYFIHYAAYHPRDYKGGELTGAMLSQIVRRGAQASTRVKQMPIANDVVLAHENDLEGCLVVVQKKGPRIEEAVVVYVETLAHNRYLKFQPTATLAGEVGSVRLQGQHPEVYIEPKGHGMEAFADQLEKARAAASPGGGSPNASTNGSSGAGSNGRSNASAAGSTNGAAGNGLVGRLTNLASRVDAARRLVNMEQPETIRIYRYSGSADDPEKVTGDVGYDLLPTYHTLWARTRRVPNETYGEAQEYGTREVKVAAASAKPIVRTVTRLSRSPRIPNSASIWTGPSEEVGSSRIRVRAPR